jgi:hypothetical protein
MLLLLLDEPTLMLFESPDKLPDWLESVDLLNNEYRFCDDNGQLFVGMNARQGGWFRAPEYVLRAQENPAIANALKLVDQAVMIIPNPWFADVASLRCYLVDRLDVGSTGHAVRQ